MARKMRSFQLVAAKLDTFRHETSPMDILLDARQTVNSKRFTVLVESIQYVIIQFVEGGYSVGEGSQFDGSQVQ